VIDADGQLKKCRMMRVGDIAPVDMAADDSGPRCINCYAAEIERFDAIDDHKFFIDPERLLYSLQWKHNGTPPDFHLALLREPREWIDFVATMLLRELTRHDPQLRDRLRGATERRIQASNCHIRCSIEFQSPS
jgi:hypothetical protein